MNRRRCVLFPLSFLLCICLIAGCVGGSTATTSTPPPPPPTNTNPAPAITAVVPSSVFAGSTDTPVTISGSGFVTSSTAQWNGTPIATTYISPTNLSMTLTTSSLANATVGKLTVINPSPGGGASAAIDFSVNNPVPAINKINPAGVLAGSSDTLLDIIGYGFVSSSVVTWNGVARNTTFVSATDVKATLPSADLSGSSASLIAVQNPSPGGGISANAAFSVSSPAPVITAISPRYVPPGTPATITITGTGFESNSIALWNGSARPTTVASTTQLQIALTAPDLQNQGTGSLAISNPPPAASTSPAAQLNITAQPVPVIQSVSIGSSPAQPGSCPRLQVTITGQNFAFDSTIQANGVSLQNISYAPNATTLVNFLPLGFVSNPGALSFTVTNPDFGPIVSDPFPYPATSPSALTLCASPSPTTVFAGSSFSFTVQPSEVNITGNGTISLGALPTGITSTNNSSLPLPPTGATLHLQAANSTATGTYDLALNGMAGTATSTGDFNFTVSTGPVPSFFFILPLARELGVPIGGSASLQYGTSVNSIGSVDFDITPSVSGLPAGTTASFSPSVFSVGQSVTVTLSAASTAPVTQNASVTLTGTPSAQVASASATFLADVTQPPGSLPGNRTDFVSTAGTPYAAVYDPTHNLIFSSNPDWNRIDVISNVTHKIVKSIPVRSPRGLDITQDRAHVWVQTASPNILSIDTVSLQARPYVLPSGPVTSAGMPVSFGSDRLLALSDGTLFVYFFDSGGYVGPQVGVWNPQTNQMTVLQTGLVFTFATPVRSGDGTRVFAVNATPNAPGMYVYNVSSRTLSTIASATTNSMVLAVNSDGSKLVLSTPLTGLQLYDSNLVLLGTLPGTLPSSGSPINGGILFGTDSTKLYELVIYDGVPVVLTVDAVTLKVLGTAPAAVTTPVSTSGANAVAAPFAIDASGLVLGVQRYGISFEDSTFYQTYVANQPPVSGDLIYTATYAGPLAGGTASSLYTFPDLTPDVWFGQTRGSANISQGQLSFTSPPSATPGPVNVKFIYPNGEQALAPQLFSYSTFPQYSLMSGSAPNGGAPAQVIGYGLPQDASGGTITVGSSTATITSTVGQYPPFSGEPIPSAILKYTLPPGTPGWADLQIATPIGSGTLPKSIFYAKSVTDYSSPDSFTAVVFDEKRKQVYLSAGDHIDVFSTASNQFVAPLNPAAQGSKKQFAGLALTPDGSQLLAANVLDGSLAIINPDTSTTFAIPIALAGLGVNNCQVGPLYVAATSANQAFVGYGSLPAPSCPSSGPLYLANLQTHTVIQPQGTSQCTGAITLDATGDGNFVAIGGGPCIYSVQSSSYTKGSFPYPLTTSSVAISSDANVIASDQIFGDVHVNMLGSIAHPTPFYGSSTPSPQNPPSVLLRPRLNASGSLYYLSYPNYFEIVDVAHAALRIRFSLTETIQWTASPLAIDSGGRYIYLITDKGLTVVDLGAAPLSIGHLSQQNASAGNQILVRGSGFDSSITAMIGGVAASVSIGDENTLTLRVPAAPSGPQDIVLTRADGEIYTLENGVVLP